MPQHTLLQIIEYSISKEPLWVLWVAFLEGYLIEMALVFSVKVVVLLVFQRWCLLWESQYLWLYQIFLRFKMFDFAFQISWIDQQLNELYQLRLRAHILFELHFQHHLLPRKDGEHHHRPYCIFVDDWLHRVQGVVELYCIPKLKHKIL